MTILVRLLRTSTRPMKHLNGRLKESGLGSLIPMHPCRILENTGTSSDAGLLRNLSVESAAGALNTTYRRRTSCR